MRAGEKLTAGTLERMGVNPGASNRSFNSSQTEVRQLPPVHCKRIGS